MRPLFSLILFFFLFLLACSQGDVTVPKPRIYPKVIYPKKSYEVFELQKCPFRFEIPSYARAERDTLFFDEKPPNDCWLNILFPDFNGQLYCSYYPVKKPADLDKLIADGHKISSKHIVRADYIDELTISKPDKNVMGVLFDVQGAAASGLQFYLTDSKKHFFLASLYFNTEVRPDSIKPIFEFVRNDVLHLIETFEWK